MYENRKLKFLGLWEGTITNLAHAKFKKLVPTYLKSRNFDVYGGRYKNKLGSY